jgi:hypothetical protein
MGRAVPTIERLVAAVALGVTLACASNRVSVSSTSSGTMASAQSTICPSGSRPLFDGQSQAGWRPYRGQGQSAGWKVQDGMLTKSTPTDDIVSTEQFGDFEITLDWRVSQGGNSGLFYRGTEEYEKIYWSAPEYALLDDANARDGRNPITSAGAAHSLYAPPARGIVKPAGEWNTTRVVARGAHVEHWLNGTKLFEFEQWSAEWDAKVAASKFRSWPNFGKARRGHFAIQGDHGGEFALRNFCLRELK